MSTNRSPVRLVLETLLHTVLFPGAVIVGIPYILLAGTHHSPSIAGPLGWLGLVLIAAGVTVGSICTWDFIVKGSGTPNPLDPPQFLVSGHLYRLVRNPMYVAVMMILLGAAAVFAAPVLVVYAAIAWVGFHLVVTLYEEPTLRRIFGESYEEYCRHVPRWMPRTRLSSPEEKTDSPAPVIAEKN